MKTLYLDLNMGAAGDMLAAALLELLPVNERLAFIEHINNIGLNNVDISFEESSRCGIHGTHLNVFINGDTEEHFHEHELHHDHVHSHDNNHEHTHLHKNHHEHKHSHEHHHTSLHDIEHLVSHLKISDKVKSNVLNIYNIIAEAEGKAHGCLVSEVHFHEVGMMDAVADICMSCLLIDIISPDKIVASPIHVGNGTVKCAHGIMPVPAPATANILKDIPIYSGDIMTELCTPTGAAIVKYFVSEFSNSPSMTINSIGYGLGTKDFDNRANALRAILCNSDSSSNDTCFLLSCNVDDMTGEEIGFAIEEFIKIGAKDAFTQPYFGKKSRPGNIINVLVDHALKDTIISEIFRLTSTIGIREIEVNRYVLDRHIESIETEFGKVHRKVSSGYGVTNSKFEFDDIADIANNNKLSITEVKERLNRYI